MYNLCITTREGAFDVVTCCVYVQCCTEELALCVFVVCVCMKSERGGERERRVVEAMIKLFSVKEKQRTAAAAAADGQDAGGDRQSNAGKLTAGELRIQKV